MQSFYVFGDSIAFGQFVSPHNTWTTKLSEFWSQQNKHNLFQVSAFNGETTTQALQRFEYCVLNHKPNIVWLQYGLNDSNFWPIENQSSRVSPDEFRANFIKMINLLRHQGCKKIFVGTNHRVMKAKLSTDMQDKYWQNAKSFNSLLREIAAGELEHVELVDIEKQFSSSFTNCLDYLLPDGVHLNITGHHKFYEIAKRHLEYFL